MKHRERKGFFVYLCVLVILMVGIWIFNNSRVVDKLRSKDVSMNAMEDRGSRPSQSGWLHLQRTRIFDENDEEVVLHGVSLHGISWFSQFVNENLFAELSNDWNTNIIRIPIYSTEYVDGKSKEMMELLKQAIQYAIDNDMYIIVDWHILDDKNPNVYKKDAKNFFYEISSEYGDIPNIIYEICNEPNGDTTWDEVRRYANEVIPVIRFNTKKSLIVVGTPDYCRDLNGPLERPIVGFGDIMYSYHFYASSHYEDMRDELQNKINLGVPVFITECGLSEDSGEGYFKQHEISSWFKLVEDNHLSFCMWSMSNKDESSAMINSYVDKTYGFKNSDLSDCGKWVRAKNRGEDVPEFTYASNLRLFLDDLKNQPLLAYRIFAHLTLIIFVIAVLAIWIIRRISHRKFKTYADTITHEAQSVVRRLGKVFIIFSIITTINYLIWRIVLSIPFKHGKIATVCSIVLLIIEIWGFCDTIAHYISMIGIKEYKKPEVKDEDFPDVDIFIATYNEPEEILFKTVNGCKHMEYPDKSKVHIYLCDDNRRANIRALAERMGVNYFDRPDNSGAKAGNLNHALENTSSPYVVTFDADMIPRREFLMETIPYYVANEKFNEGKEEKDQIWLGILQTPQAFYSPDVFEHNLYCETRVPNEQDFFYRTIEVARTTSNSVIYGGSNTIISRRALDAVGGFYTKSITEDFATGLLIESKGFVSLALPTPLASGLSPFSFRDYVTQRIRWGRGVINTAKDLHICRNKNLSIAQKISYLSSVSYWYSSVKNLIYLLSPLMFAAFAIPVFDCNGKDILLFWLPMFIMQTLALRFISFGSISNKWAGIQETCMMPFMLLPILAETVGKSLSKFKVTDKGGSSTKRKVDTRAMMPLVFFSVLSLLGIIQMFYVLITDKAIGILVILFWLFRNLYYLVMSIFLCDGRPFNGENVVVKDAEFVTVFDKEGAAHEGITTCLTEHNVAVFLDDLNALKIGEVIKLNVNTGVYDIANLSGVVTGVTNSNRNTVPDLYTIEIIDFKNQFEVYLQILYDRIPTLPQKLRNDHPPIVDMWRNLAKRVDRE